MDMTTIIIIVFCLGILSFLFWPIRLLISLILIPLQILSTLLKAINGVMGQKPKTTSRQSVIKNNIQVEDNSTEEAESVLPNQEKLLKKLRNGI